MSLTARFRGPGLTSTDVALGLRAFGSQVSEVYWDYGYGVGVPGVLYSWGAGLGLVSDCAVALWNRCLCCYLYSFSAGLRCRIGSFRK